MKILHTADLHLGAPLRAHLPPKEAKLRRGELLSTFFRILRLARAERCEAVLLAGDLFDTEAAAAMLASTVLSEIEKYREIDFYYACGNHEGFRWIPKELPTNFHIFRKSLTYFEKKNIVFCGASNPKASVFSNICLQKRSINILVLHGSWDGGNAKNADIPLGFLARSNIDYCALGHYHAYAERRIDTRGIAVYCGCPEGRGFDELGPKGVVLIEATDGYVTHSFVPLPGRAFHRLTVDISDAKNLLDVFSLCETAIDVPKAEDFVRLVLIGKRTVCPVPDVESIERHFRDRFYYLEIEDESTTAPDLRALYGERSLRGEFVRTVEADSTLGEEEKMRILSLGLAALDTDTGGNTL